MFNKLKIRFVFLTSVFIFLQVNSFGDSGDSRWLVSPELLKHSNLKVVWQNELPFKEKESLSELHIIDGRIYALSDRNYMVSVDREKGNVIFSKAVGPAGFPVLGLEQYEGELFSIIGNKLVEINPDTGDERTVERLKFHAVCPASRNSLYFYVSGSDRRLHVLRADNKLQIFEVAADNDCMITSVNADDGFAIFGTAAGNVISITPDGPTRLWQFDAGNGIVGPMVRDGLSLFFASEDTNVYRIDIFRREKLVWKYQTAAKLDKSPHVTQGVVYQYVSNKGLAAINKESGELIWQLAEGVDLLAEADGKAYVITNIGTLAVMDNKRAKKLYSVNFAGVSRYAVNAADSKIYIADESGRIACLEPVE